MYFQILIRGSVKQVKPLMPSGVNRKDFYMQNKQYQRHGLKKKVGLKQRSKTETILITSSDTPDHLDITVQQIHAQNSNQGILGHKDHFIITLDGKVHKGRDQDTVGFGVDHTTISILMIGKDNFTETQKTSLRILVKKLKEQYSNDLQLQNKTNITRV